ncbi:hypothetical protein CEXT_707661 [Caerostris extrusa]|uniref:ShKT domain-containing protein n=1 Tax=Caerostris extrusa TaxID=172846 RepID=A0AAV4X2S1_CAEEX|nr:hypothetical protein CEXT_707661 [Caerostris extrusa]
MIFRKRNTFCPILMQPIAPITMLYGNKTTEQDHGLSRSVIYPYFGMKYVHIYVPKKHYKRCTGCEGERMMHEYRHELCRNPLKRCLKDFSYERLHECKRMCNADCVNKVSLYHRRNPHLNHFWAEWELFSYIGGLIGCWLGISVWAFVDIIEANFKGLFV